MWKCVTRSRHQIEGKSKMRSCLIALIVCCAATVFGDAVTATEHPSSSPDTLRLIVGAYPGARANLADTKNISANIVAYPDWYIWGGSVIEEDGKYHMFAERWPRKYGFNCWLTHAEIAHYVADKPEGPFRFVKTVLPGRGAGYWDQFAAYNPYLCKFNGRFYLYYVSTSHPAIDAEGLIATARAGGKSPNWTPSAMAGSGKTPRGAQGDKARRS